MMSGEAIYALNEEIAVKAAAAGKVPYVPWNADEIGRYGDIPLPFPNIGHYRPDGWELVDHWLVDKTGQGADWEPALTIEQLKVKLLEGVDQSLGYAFIEEGEMQIVLGAFRRAGWRCDYCGHLNPGKANFCGELDTVGCSAERGAEL